MHVKCKHVGALAIALVVLKEHAQQLNAPPDLRRPNMKRYNGMSESVQQAVELALTWPQIVANLLTDPPPKPVGSNRPDKFQIQPLQNKKKTKSHPATLEAMNMKGLKDILKSLSLPVSGKKQQLIARIVENRPIPYPTNNNAAIANAPTVAKDAPRRGTARTNSQPSTKRKAAQPLATTSRAKKAKITKEIDELAADTLVFLHRASKAKR